MIEAGTPLPTTSSGRVIVVGEQALVIAATTPGGSTEATAAFWSEPGVLQFATSLIR